MTLYVWGVGCGEGHDAVHVHLGTRAIDPLTAHSRSAHYPFSHCHCPSYCYGDLHKNNPKLKSTD
jgi:hypothetical protein